MIDLQNMFSNNQAITVDAISERVIDLSPNGGPNLTKDIAGGTPLYLQVAVDSASAFTTGDAGTLGITIESDDNVSLTTATVHATVVTGLAAATLVAGYRVVRNYPLPAGAYQRYLGLRYTTTTGDFTGGKIKAWLTTDKDDNTTYESGVTTGIN